jgi:hypothetical protein
MALTFGVELEFALAYIPNNDPDPFGFKEKRTVRFVPIGEDRPLWQTNTGEPTISTAKRYVANTIHEAGHDVKLSPNGRSDITKWEVATDPSVCGPDDSLTVGPFSIWGMEVKSPALLFCSESLKAVEHICVLLTSKYCINLNESIGLHVHVGNEQHGYTFENVRKLMAFFWAFEPQLDSLHSPLRQDTYYASSMRSKSQYVHDLETDHDKRPTPSEGASYFLNFQGQDASYYEDFEEQSRITEIIRWQRSLGGVRKSAYNFFNLLSNTWSTATGSKQTIEFRQHQGSLNGPEVRAWIETVVGLINFVQDVHPTSFANLLSVLENETWGKEGDGQDRRREELMGPILAEEGFTIIDLLMTLDLWESALFYYNRGFSKHARTSPRSSLPPPPPLPPALPSSPRDFKGVIEISSGSEVCGPPPKKPTPPAKTRTTPTHKKKGLDDLGDGLHEMPLPPPK